MDFDDHALSSKEGQNLSREELVQQTKPNNSSFLTKLSQSGQQDCG